MKSNESKSRCDWELVRLPSRLIRISSDGDTVPYEDLRETVANWEHINSDVADMVIQSAIDDGIIDRENGEVLCLNEDVDTHLEGFYHVE